LQKQRFDPDHFRKGNPKRHNKDEGRRMAINFVYFEHEPGRRSAANLPTHDEARRIAP
jgi:hypothetical protein